MPNGSYSWLTLAAGVNQLAARLAIDLSGPNTPFWITNELQLYIFRSLQQYNVLTNAWKMDFQFVSPNLWNSLGSITGSPRLRTATDAQSYTMLQYYLLEDPTGAGAWGGTSQFSLTDLQNALQSRRNEMLQISACNDVLLQNIPLTPGTRRTYLPDNILDVLRVRYFASQAFPTATGSIGSNTITVTDTTGITPGQLVSGTGIAQWTLVQSVVGSVVTLTLPNIGAVSGVINFYIPTTLYRDDTVALEFYEQPLYQLTPATPETFQLSSEPPLSFDVNIAPNDDGVYEAVTLQSGTTFAPPASTLLGIPDDFVWVLEFGALADLLGREPEATDDQRAAYALKRYQDGLKLLTNTPWIMLGRINGVAVSIDSLEETDRYSVGWDLTPADFGPVIVTAGTDFLAAPVGSSVGVTCLGNAPLLDSTNTYLQISRDGWEQVLNEAQFLASFKQGGAEFAAAMELEKEFIMFCAAENSRLKSTGAFSDIILQRGQVQERAQARYNSRGNNG